MRNEVVHKVLAHPFFGGEGDVCAAKNVEDVWFSILFDYFCVVFREV